MKANLITALVALLAIAGILLGGLALSQARSARQLALSEVIVEEVNSLSTPVFDQDSGQYSYLTLYDISIANMSGPRLTLQRVKKATGAGFLAMLKGKDVVSLKVNEKAFVSDVGSTAVKNEPRLLKTVGQQDMGESSTVNIVIEPGETKVLHLGLTLQPFDADAQPLAHVALVAWELEFDNGKSYIFQRGFPIYPVK
ncbi:hypothetical protein JW998_16950 [candidate division KSB1 bacterium]|nr:hypothetical protein [candidate division KSB1 bacterium]